VQKALLAIHLKRASYDVLQPFSLRVHAIGRDKLGDHFRRRRSRWYAPLEDAGVLPAGAQDGQ
jgi:hypothetical protein